MASPARWREALRPPPQARAGALAHGRMDAAALRQVAAAHDVCPYYLAQELTRWSDVVVGDYNYYYDATAMLHALTQASQVEGRSAGGRGA